jgi:exopolyphosphatase / guanosine-5'-triphosphate,3'-diphosphate pyrophosphatase
MTSRVALLAEGAERRIAVIDMGSNTFRLVVFRYRPGGAFRLVDEIRDTVRLSRGAGADGIRPEAVERARHTAHLYAAFCAAEAIDEVDAVTTSAARDAPNREDVLRALTAEGRLPVRVLSEGEEARYGYLGAVNSTTLYDGWVLDLGGGSIQATEVRGRAMGRSVSRPLGAVRMTEAFIGADVPARADIKSLRRHVERTLAGVPWLGGLGERAVGIGGTVRTLARMAQKAERYPLDELHGYLLDRDALRDLIERMAALPAAGRVALPGLKTDRADITLAGAVVIATAMDIAGVTRIEICSQGLREGVFYERLLGAPGGALIGDVRRHSVLNLMDAYRCDATHCAQVGDLALSLYDQLAALGMQRADDGEREVLWAAAMLHDAGVAVDYNDHHKHGYYLVLNSGLPGYTHEEIAMVALLVRGHRKALPSPSPLDRALGADGRGRLQRLGACLRVAEQLAQSRTVTGVELRDDGERLHAAVADAGDPTVAVWSAGRESPAMQRAVGRGLTVSAAPRR